MPIHAAPPKASSTVFNHPGRSLSNNGTRSLFFQAIKYLEIFIACESSGLWLCCGSPVGPTENPPVLRCNVHCRANVWRDVQGIVTVRQTHFMIMGTRNLFFQAYGLSSGGWHITSSSLMLVNPAECSFAVAGPRKVSCV